VSNETQGETSIFLICYKLTTAKMMLALTKDLEFDRKKEGRACQGCVEGGGKVWWLGDDGKEVIEVCVWR
jgi:hypothetical protein